MASHSDSLAYSVTLLKWTDVAKALREFKKKRNAGFYLEVTELYDDQYQVKVYKHANALADPNDRAPKARRADRKAH